MIKRLLNFIFGEDNTCCREDTKPEINNISEPVISFLKCFKDNPKRFKVSCGLYTVEMSMNITQTYFITDKENGIKYKYSACPLRDERNDCIDARKLLSHQEITHVISVFEAEFKDRQERYNQILKQRKQRERVKLRNRLTKIYQQKG